MEIIVTMMVFGSMMFIMALGVMFNRPPLKGSCGGVGGNCPCADSGTPGACKIESEDSASASSTMTLVGQDDNGVQLYGTKE